MSKPEVEEAVKEVFVAIANDLRDRGIKVSLMDAKKDWPTDAREAIKVFAEGVAEEWLSSLEDYET